LWPFRTETMRNMKRNFSCNLADFRRRCSIDFGATVGRQVSHLTAGDRRSKFVSLNGPLAREAAKWRTAYHAMPWACEAPPYRSEPWACGACPSIPKVGPSPHEQREKPLGCLNVQAAGLRDVRSTKRGGEHDRRKSNWHRWRR